MNKPMSRFLPLVFSLVLPLTASAGDPAASPIWRAQSLAEAIALMVLFALVGVVVAIAGYRLFDKFTPGDLHKEILENKNVAVAIIAAAVILGVCLIVAAAIMG